VSSVEPGKRPALGQKSLGRGKSSRSGETLGRQARTTPGRTRGGRHRQTPHGSWRVVVVWVLSDWAPTLRAMLLLATALVGVAVVITAVLGVGRAALVAVVPPLVVLATIAFRQARRSRRG
jgi:hypothetical protein